MSERSEDNARQKAPKLTVETAAAEDAFDDRADRAEDSPKGFFIDEEDLQDAVGFIRGAGATAWKYAVHHPFTVTYGFIGLILAVLILLIGLWDTIVIAVFVIVGAMIGQIRDGDNGIVNFFRRLVSGRR